LRGSGIERIDVGFSSSEVAGSVEVGEPDGNGGLLRLGGNRPTIPALPAEELEAACDLRAAKDVFERQVALGGKHVTGGCEGRQECEFTPFDRSSNGWSHLFMEKAERWLRPVVDDEHGDAGVHCGGDGADGPALEKDGGQERHVDGQDQQPVVHAVVKRSLDAANWPAVWMQVGDERSIDREPRIAAKDVDVCAEAAKLRDGVFDKRLAGQFQQRFSVPMRELRPPART